MKSLYPPIEPYSVHHVGVGNGHAVYVEECGNPEGIPAVFLHGGPGSGCRSHHRSFFDPERYRAILVDQRGCGRSTPHGRLRNNTTRHLLGDLESIRACLNIPKWLIFGGSWGAALALLYAQAHPERVSGLVLRGSFLARKRDVDWFVRDGASRFYPEDWQRFIDNFSPKERTNPVGAARRRVNGADELEQRRMARAWWLWSTRVTLGDAFNPPDDESLPVDALSQCRIELHYAAARYFLREGQILEDCPKIAHIPAIIVHGRQDRVCPPEAAWLLHRALPRSELKILPNSGHIAQGEEMIDALVTALETLTGRLSA
ncbi:prolyl aminopeptidase [Methylococcus geothermalis]|uniref:Proline iminopeptidase n=1 Tax=Methylococcus geothermalis TaxID=2681310 RepID=A0A858Q992_9GAMM|nr:prolyl aminopeptidase [Methylococcus geothermalis]QJD30351.1 prolyl aminopeptidase [Methylococcus geothermalis]